MTMIGVRLISGPALSRFTSADSQPHWKTATVAPRAAPTVSRKPSTPTSGTRIDRNTSTSRITARPTTIVR